MQIIAVSVYAAVVRHGTEYGVLVIRVVAVTRASTAWPGREGGKGKVAVVPSAPSPVEMEIVGIVVSVAKETVAALPVLILSGIQNGMCIVQLGFQHDNPLCVGVIILSPTDEGWGIVEVILQSFFRSRIVGIITCYFRVRKVGT